ncbi:hypothetical protein FHL15_005952 [Xylaria flabelliformis]|uniref:Uncharacterized protein n=1 Tax=Xylaria flabelliformis TaxID=2512241 RepID=A0A553HYS0_9PEZI|nr:hypothetical protein FHL15_005952 [Xylaria flabelliformis]
MSFNRDNSSSEREGEDIPLQNMRPATTFDELLPKINAPPPKLKRTKTLLQRAGTLTRRLLIGPNLKERSSDNPIDQALDNMADKSHYAKLRKRIRSEGRSALLDDLLKLAEYEKVYLGLRPRTEWEVMTEEEIAKAQLADLVVARLAGPMPEGRFTGKYIFLARDKHLCVSHDKLGHGLAQIHPADESDVANVREIARAYYYFCDN